MTYRNAPAARARARARAASMAAASTAATAPGPGSITVQVDRIRCDGYGMCAELLPEFIELDDWGYPIVRADAVPGHLLGLARRAVDVCPVLALKLATMPARQLGRDPRA